MIIELVRLQTVAQPPRIGDKVGFANWTGCCPTVAQKAGLRGSRLVVAPGVGQGPHPQFFIVPNPELLKLRVYTQKKWTRAFPIWQSALGSGRMRDWARVPARNVQALWAVTALFTQPKASAMDRMLCLGKARNLASGLACDATHTAPSGVN